MATVVPNYSFSLGLGMEECAGFFPPPKARVVYPINSDKWAMFEACSGWPRQEHERVSAVFPRFCRHKLERAKGFEPSTPTLARGSASGPNYLTFLVIPS